MKVSDVMSRDVDHVSVHTKVEDVAALIFGRGINGVPVIDKNRKLVGFITERDILVKFYPSMTEYVDDTFHSSDFERMEGKVNQIFELRAEDIMTKHPISVSTDAPLLRAQSLMFIQKIGRLPVVNDEGKLVGIISKGDIFRAVVGDRLLFTENQEYNDWLSKTYYASVDVSNRLTYEIPDLLKVFSENQVLNVLDVGCGTGDHAIALAKKGFHVIGTDRSPAMIAEANKRKETAFKDKAVSDRVKFIYGETGVVIRKLDTIFNAVLFLGNTISHNPKHVGDLIRSVDDYLSDSGVIIFQITNFEKVLKVDKRFLEFNFAKLKDGVEQEYGFLEFYNEPDRKEKTIQKTFAILRSSGKSWRWSGVRNSTMAYLDKQSITDVLKKNGFSKISYYGGSFDGKNWDYLFRKPFEPLKSDWLNIIAKK